MANYGLQGEEQHIVQTFLVEMLRQHSSVHLKHSTMTE
jgi:hypothetical protein